MEEAISAMYREDLDAVRTWVSDDPSLINWVNEHGTTLWHEAVKHDHIELVQEFIDAGAQIDQPGIDGISAVHCAVRIRSVPITQLLVSHGANINSRDKNGNSPLWNLLMERRAKDTDRDRPIVEFLLANGADPTIENDHGNTSLSLLKMPKNAGIVDLFSDWT